MVKQSYIGFLGLDLALLAKCNHSILSYGTFSFWSGFLAGGKRIIPAMILKQWNSPLMIDIGHFVFPDEGLTYESSQEKRERYDYLVKI